MFRKIIVLLVTFLAFAGVAKAQLDDVDDGFTIVDNTFNPNRALDSLHAGHKKVPKRLKVWTIDDRFGDIIPQLPDTTHENFMNSVFTAGRYGEYNTTGNLGSPRIARIATDRDFRPDFAFTEPLGYFNTKPTELRYTNTLSPITHLYFNSCGSRDNGEDHLKVLFATNVNKEAGFGFKFDYLYGRGYYQSQNTSLFDYTMWGSYLGPRYQAHLSFSIDHSKNSENGGIVNDDYVTHPESTSESYDTDEIPVNFSNNWNRNHSFQMNLAHRYNIGFNKKVPMTEEEKEAKRFAMKAKAEQEAAKKAAQQEEQPKGRPDDAKISDMTLGRPDDAKIVGDINNDSLKLALQEAKKQQEELADSLKQLAETEKEDTSWLKDEYVPVTSFIHSLRLESNERTYLAYKTPSEYFLDRYDFINYSAPGDSLYDVTNRFAMRNIFAVSLHEGLNKYVPMGAKLFIAHQLRSYELPALGENLTTKYNEMNFSAGAQIIKTTGKKFNYTATGELTFAGEDVGDVKIDGEGSMGFHLFKDTVSVNLKAFYHLTNPEFLQRHYHSKFLWWDHDGFNKQMHTHLEGIFNVGRTNTTLRLAYDNLQNLVYLAESYSRTTNKAITGFTADYRQTSKNISLLTASLQQDLTYGVLNWQNRITFQKSSDQNILPVPAINVWTNLFLKFRIAKVLRVQFGVEAYYFTKYNAPEYCAHLGQYAVQENEEVKTEVGNYPIINAYINCKLRQCRFFVMMTHLNASSGSGNYFLTPHHPLNKSVLRLGLAWIFNN